MQNLTLTITELGAHGDGIATHQGKRIFVPYSCPEDTVQATLTSNTHATITNIIAPSPLRQTPACQHFGQCGGCNLQHLNTPTYKAFKERSLKDFIHSMGISPDVLSPMAEITTHSRRRAEFKVVVAQDNIGIGFHAARSHQLIELHECPISDPALMSILPSFKQCLRGLKKPGRISSLQLTSLNAGQDATIGLRSTLHKADQTTLIEWASHSTIIRLNSQLQHEKTSSPNSITRLYDEGNATINLGGVTVQLPPNAFLQASQAGEHALNAFVLKHMSGRQHVADLYAGCGTHSFPLIPHVKHISAYEGAPDMSAAMNNAAANAGLSERITTNTRDLFRHPLNAQELTHFDGIIINPPRNGALPQTKAIAASHIPHVTMISCDPATFKRDATELLRAGYQLTNAQLIDQFYWSNHQEIAAQFTYN